MLEPQEKWNHDTGVHRSLVPGQPTQGREVLGNHPSKRMTSLDTR